MLIFQSTCPARGTTVACDAMPLSSVISIHVPREGHDVKLYFMTSAYRNFNPRAPRGARLVYRSSSSFPPRFQSTCPARGTTQYSPVLPGLYLISIHVPREGHDYREATSSKGRYGFQSTCPARGTTTLAQPPFFYNYIFQSTCPARGTTERRYHRRQHRQNFNPRAPRGARQLSNACATATAGISIHVPREGHDSGILGSVDFAAAFQSTCPARGTTAMRNMVCTRQHHFNPRAPRGARQTCHCASFCKK